MHNQNNINGKRLVLLVICESAFSCPRKCFAPGPVPRLAGPRTLSAPNRVGWLRPAVVGALAYLARASADTARTVPSVRETANVHNRLSHSGQRGRRFFFKRRMTSGQIDGSDALGDRAATTPDACGHRCPRRGQAAPARRLTGPRKPFRLRPNCVHEKPKGLAGGG